MDHTNRKHGWSIDTQPWCHHLIWRRSNSWWNYKRISLWLHLHQKSRLFGMHSHSPNLLFSIYGYLHQIFLYHPSSLFLRWSQYLWNGHLASLRVLESLCWKIRSICSECSVHRPFIKFLWNGHHCILRQNRSLIQILLRTRHSNSFLPILHILHT